MKIDVHDGSISFSSGTVQRKQSRTSFLSTSLGANANEQIANPKEDWRHISIAPERGVAATLIFQGERLHQVFVGMTLASGDSDEWTINSEMGRKAKHDEWLRAELGDPPYDYVWGRISSEFDAKGCVSEIIVTYAS